MENYGTKCAFKECNQLDFLPFDCRYCQQKFCQNHRQPDQHNCEKIEKNAEKRPVSSSKEKKDRCPMPNCRTILTLTNQHECKNCGLNTCLACRFPEKHNCKALNNNNKNNFKQQNKKPITNPEKKQKKKSAFSFFCCGGDKNKQKRKKEMKQKK
ncbi:hypothetical protein PPERSA_08751 [Pseudocohnilembus persalinus]|uniref:AN1-type domain-containing protein n=1 Tax=Pseudocohnilembus persalinus TaxID=266149 RepID=A0A0V0R7G2_PSEPJ|nr:hypothetical protein PPERSA_08751 [Pseudocohnilembus persalinus]|eukprot:KRX10449.1 hypothetical protein PPERSA_08751 [Pseudocohnilembus persalinus]